MFKMETSVYVCVCVHVRVNTYLLRLCGNRQSEIFEMNLAGLEWKQLLFSVYKVLFKCF